MLISNSLAFVFIGLIVIFSLIAGIVSTLVIISKREMTSVTHEEEKKEVVEEENDVIKIHK